MFRRIFLALAAVVALSSAARAEAPTSVVFFAEWSGALDDAARNVIAHVAEAAKQSQDAPVTITGYADNKGSDQANQFLCQLRAQVVLDALTADGVEASRMSVTIGGAQPLAGVMGRRVEIVVGGAGH